MSYNPRVLRANRIHGPGKHRQVEIAFIKEKLYANGVFSNVYSATLTKPTILPVAIKKCWPRNSAARKTVLVNSKTTSSEEDREDANNGKAETELLSKLKHTHVVLLLYAFSVYVDSDVSLLRMNETERVIMQIIIMNLTEKKTSQLILCFHEIYTYRIYFRYATAWSWNLCLQIWEK